MKLTVMLDCNGQPREALPVRAIPYFTRWMACPSVITNSFAQAEDRKRIRDVLSWRILDGEIRKVRPFDWEHVYIAMAAHEEKIPRTDSGTDDWRRESVNALPASTFVWLDEFEIGFKRAFATELFAEFGNDEQRALEEVLDVAPLLPPGSFDAIMEGFVAPGFRNFVAQTKALTGSEQIDHAMKDAPPEPKTWEQTAYSIGSKWMEEQIQLAKEGKKLSWQNSKSKSCPGVNAIAEFVEGELSNQGIKGKRGRFLDQETIKRAALTGITGRHRTGKK
jgi:hypothetical protein